MRKANSLQRAAPTLLIVLLVGALLLSGCAAPQSGNTVDTTNGNQAAPAASSQFPQNSPRTQGMPGSGFRGQNLTPEQRQAMMTQRLQQAADACSGMNAGDQCTINSTRGALQGSCADQNGTVRCVVPNMGRGMYNRTTPYSGAPAAQ